MTLYKFDCLSGFPIDLVANFPSVWFHINRRNVMRWFHSNPMFLWIAEFVCTWVYLRLIREPDVHLLWFQIDRRIVNTVWLSYSQLIFYSLLLRLGLRFRFSDCFDSQTLIHLIPDRSWERCYDYVQIRCISEILSLFYSVLCSRFSDRSGSVGGSWTLSDSVLYNYIKSK